MTRSHCDWTHDDLYIEWNDEVRELYDLGLVELSEELDKKYGSGLGFSNPITGLASLRLHNPIVSGQT